MQTCRAIKLKWYRANGQPGYEGFLRKDVVAIPELLLDAGYHTYMTGKWHLGAGNNNPQARGFERSFALLNGAASHWADQGAIIPGSATRYISDGEIVEDLPADFYSSCRYLLFKAGNQPEILNH